MHLDCKGHLVPAYDGCCGTTTDLRTIVAGPIICEVPCHVGYTPGNAGTVSVWVAPKHFSWLGFTERDRAHDRPSRRPVRFSRGWER